MTKKELVKIIREVVKREVKNVLNEQFSAQQPIKKKQTKKTYSKNPILNEVLKETSDYETVATMNSSDVSGFRSKFMSMQGGMNGPVQHTDVHGKPVDVNQLGGGLDKVLTRDYSALVKTFDKKKK